MTTKTTEAQIDFQRVQEVIYWAKKWEISPHQLMEAYHAIQTNNIKKIEAYLREKGFAL